ncbi:MAG: hypothetical protein ABI114_11215 [Rhodanobacter sp.]
MQKMKGLAEKLAVAFSTRKTVDIASCTHFCAYRYGRHETNPYETYMQGLAQGLPLQDIRHAFIEYLRHYRPTTLGDALGVSLSVPYPLWFLPWRTLSQVTSMPGWHPTPDYFVDAMTFFSPLGIPRRLLNKEFSWHEDAFNAMKSTGYLPQRYGYITVRELKGETSVYIVTDGNHRLSALSALGYTSVAVKQSPGSIVHRTHVARWPLVREGIVSQDDALKIFDAYVDGNMKPMHTPIPAEIV